MNKLIILSLALLTCSGCTSLAKLDSQIPDGKYDSVRTGVTGKFTSTAIEAKGVKKDGKWVEGELHFKHTDPWVTDSYIDLKFKQ